MELTPKTYVGQISRLMAGNPHAVRYYKWFMKKAKEFRPRHFTEEEEEILAPFRRVKKSYKAGQCYYNAQRLALFHPQHFKYYEGFAMGIIPTEHAWVTLNGKVFDITWENIPKSVSGGGVTHTKGNSYYGIHVPNTYISQIWAKTKMAMPALLEYAKDENVV